LVVRVSEFDAARLSRDAQVAGEAFGFEDVEGELPPEAAGAFAVWWIAGVAAFACAVGYSLL
jgi:hypothetical protein